MSSDSVCCNRNKLLLDIEREKKEEWLRRRKFRIQQVRQQARDMAAKMRNKVKNEQEYNQLQEKVKAEAKNKVEEAKKLAELKKRHEIRLQTFGAAHESAAKQPDSNALYKEHTQIIQSVAQARGALANDRVKQQQSLLKEKDKIASQRKLLINETEKVRSALISSLPARKTSPRTPTSKPVSPKKAAVKSPKPKEKEVPLKPIVSVEELNFRIPSPMNHSTGSIDFNSDDSDDSSTTWPPRSARKSRLSSLPKVILYDHNQRKCKEYTKPSVSVNHINEVGTKQMGLEIQKQEQAENIHFINQQKKQQHSNTRSRRALYREQSTIEFGNMIGYLTTLERKERMQRAALSIPSPPKFVPRTKVLSPTKSEKSFEQAEENIQREEMDKGKTDKCLNTLYEYLQKEREISHPNSTKQLNESHESNECEVPGWVLSGVNEGKENFSSIKWNKETESGVTKTAVPNLEVNNGGEPDIQETSKETESNEPESEKQGESDEFVVKTCIPKETEADIEKADSCDIKVVVKVSAKKNDSDDSKNTSSTSYRSPPDRLSPEQQKVLETVLSRVYKNNENTTLRKYVIDLLNKSRGAVNDFSVSTVSDETFSSDICNISTNVERDDLCSAFTRRIKNLTEMLENCDLFDDTLSQTSLPSRIHEPINLGQQGILSLPEDSVCTGASDYIEQRDFKLPYQINPKPFAKDNRNNLSTIPEQSEQSKMQGFDRTISSISDFDNDVLTENDVMNNFLNSSMSSSSSMEGIEEVFRSLGIGWALSQLRKTRESHKLEDTSSSEKNNQVGPRSKSTSIRHSTPVKKDPKERQSGKLSLTPPCLSLNNPYLPSKPNRKSY